VQSLRGKPAEALRTLEPALAFFAQHKYRKFELTALSIAARVYQDLDDIPKARELASQGLKEAEATGDDSKLSLALNSLAAQATVLGSLPEALTLRERAEAIHRRQNDTLLLPYDLTNRAELLIRLGRFDDASAALAEVDAGVAKNVESYVGRQRRVAFLRALFATLSNQLAQASTLIKAIPASASPSPTSALVSDMERYVEAKSGHRTAPSFESPVQSTEPATDRERQYWIAAAAVARGDGRAALAAAAIGLERASKIGNDELAWRLAAIGAAAARIVGDQEQERALKVRAIAFRKRLRTSWGIQATRYEQRPDLVELRKASQLED
jgi:tetratricopeptide (TPR) repeat protein